jgi:hypothetical protein
LAGTRTLIQRAIASLRARGTDAHLWLPGVGTVSGLTTGNYLESTGNTLATVDNPTGLVLDALGTVGSELSSYAASPQTTSGAISTVLSASLVVGKTYKVSYTARSTGSVQIGVLTGAYGWQSGNPATVASATDVTASFIFVASDTVGRSAIYPVSGTAVATVSVREVTGIHLTQGTTANKPVLRRGLTNLLTYSSDFSNAVWLTASGASKSGGNLVLSNTYASYVRQATSLLPVGSTVTAAFLLSGTPGVHIYIAVQDQGGAFPQTALQITLTATPTLYTVTRPTTTQASVDARILDSGTATTVTFGGAALFQGTLTASQILAAGGIPVTTTAAASNPDAGRYSWAFDGTNDSLALGSVPFQMGDDHCVIAACQLNTAGTTKAIFTCFGATSTPVILLGFNSTGNAIAYWSDDASTLAIIGGSAVLTGSPVVVSMLKVGSVKVLRVNGVQVATTSVVTGTTTLTGASVGSQGAIGNYVTGSVGQVISIRGTVDRRRTADVRTAR